MAADFRAHPMLMNAHLQTLLPALIRPTPALCFERERWELPDGDFIDLGWFARPENGAPIAVLVHGLTGGFESKYLRATARQLQLQGWGGVMLQLRGAGAEPNRLPQAYHQGDTGDLLALLHRLRRQCPDSPIASVGWSLGGNVVLKAAGEAGQDYPADLVAAASVPFELEPCALRMREGFSRIYQRRLLGQLKQAAQLKAARVVLPARVNLVSTLAAPDFLVFDEAWTAPLNGFSGARDYYVRTQCRPYLRQICKPTLIVHSKDDPFMRPEIVPAAADLAPGVRLELASHGGHVGFIGAGPRGALDFWLERRLVAWLQDQIQT